MNVWKITPNLLIRGRFDNRPDRVQELWDLDVDVVICMLKKRDQELTDAATASYGAFRYLNFPISDSKGPAPERSLQNAWRAAHFAHDAISALHQTVLIHCIGARDRAPFTAALTLHLLEGISGNEAMLRVRAKKKTTFYNEGYRAYLNELKVTP